MFVGVVGVVGVLVCVVVVVIGIMWVLFWFGMLFMLLVSLCFRILCFCCFFCCCWVLGCWLLFLVGIGMVLVVCGCVDVGMLFINFGGSGGCFFMGWGLVVCVVFSGFRWSDGEDGGVCFWDDCLVCVGVFWVFWCGRY